jgi:hypothetical protein
MTVVYWGAYLQAWDRDFMKHIYIALLIVISLSRGAIANVQLFPPTSCNGDEVKVISWIDDGASSTMCLSGSDLLTKLSYPTCSDGQTLVFRDYGRGPVGMGAVAMHSGFYCETAGATATYPTCASGEFLTTQTIDGNTSLTCKPSCDNCAAALPNCAAGQFLTSANGAMICSDLPTMGATWQNEDLNSTEPFVLNCEYRMAITTPSCMMNNHGYLYATYVDTTNIQHGRDIYDMLISSSNRRSMRWWVEQVPNFHYCDVASIEKRCM